MGSTEVNYAAWWSAVAASFSALSSLTMVLIQRRNLMESVRPEIILNDWDNQDVIDAEGGRQRIRFRKISNVGKGTAFNISVGSRKEIREGDRPTVFIPTIRLPVVPKDETGVVDGEILIFWENIEGHDKSKHCPIDIHVVYLDGLNNIYDTVFKAMAQRTESADRRPSIFMKQVIWTSKETTRQPLWRRRLARRFGMGWGAIKRGPKPTP